MILNLMIFTEKQKFINLGHVSTDKLHFKSYPGYELLSKLEYFSCHFFCSLHFSLSLSFSFQFDYLMRASPMISNIKRKTDLKGSNMNLAMLLNALIPF